MAEALVNKAHQRLGRGLNLARNRLTLRAGEALVAQNCDREHTDAIRKRSGNELLYQFTRDGDPNQPTPVVNIYNHEWDYPCRGQIHRHLFVLADGSVHMREAGDGFSEITVPGATIDNVLTDHASFVTVDGDTFIAIGKGRLRLFDGERLYFAGLEPPTVAASALAAGVAGALTGDFKYKITYVYRTDETFRESSPSPAMAAAFTIAADNIDVSWTAHPNGLGTPNDERCNGYRIYRTVDLSTAFADDQAYFLVTEIDDVTTTTYEDSTPTTSPTSLAPNLRPIPPEGVKLLAEHSDSLFMGSPKFNRMGFVYSESDNPEYVPTVNSTKIPDASATNLTAFFKISGVFGCMTEDKIYNIAGSSPQDFVHREMSSFTGCLSPSSLQVFNDVVTFVGKHGIFAWDGTRPILLTSEIEDEVKGLSFDTYRKTYAAVYQERNHYYVSMETRDGGRHIWVLDYTSESVSAGDGVEAELSDQRASRAWFEYTGMLATSMGVVRSYGTRESILYWGDDNGHLYLYDRGDTDAGADIEMKYHYAFKPATKRTAHPIDETFRVRMVSMLTDQYQGTARIGLQFLRSHVPQMFFKPYRKKDIPLGEGKDTQERFAHNGSGLAIVAVEHSGPGKFRVLGMSHDWQPLGRRHQVV